MAHLTGIGIENFRVFKDYTEFDFAPITILTGANSSGKSSLFKALLLLKESFEYNNGVIERLKFDRLNIGSYEMNISKKANEESTKSITISLPFPSKFNNDLKIHFSFTEIKEKQANGLYQVKVFCKENCILDITQKRIFIDLLKFKQWIDESKKDLDKRLTREKIFNFTEKELDEDYPLPSLKNYHVGSPLLRNLIEDDLTNYESEFLFNIRDTSVDLGKIVKEFHSDTLEHTLEPNFYSYGKAFIELSNYITQLKNFGQKYTFSVSAEYTDEGELIHEDDYIEKPFPENRYVITENAITFFNIIIEGIKDSLSEISISHFEYLTPYRANQQILHTTDSQRTDYSSLLDRFYKENKPKLNIINEVLRILGDFGELDIENLGKNADRNLDINAYIVFLKKGEKKTLLSNLGFGVTQLITLLLQIAVSKEGTTIIIEEPETNLHPKLQSQLAELFLDCNREFGVRFIIETHSEYLIRGLQEQIAEKPNQKDDAIIYYLRNPENLLEGKKQVEKIKFDEFGNIDYKAFDSGFYDEHYNRTYGLLNKQRDKFFEMFDRLREINRDRSDEDILTETEKLIDSLVKSQDLTNYRQDIEREIGNTLFQKIDDTSKKYLESAEYLWQISQQSNDFSPVIVQFGRAVENQLYALLEEFKTDSISFSTKGYERSYEHLSLNYPIGILNIQKVVESSEVDNKIEGNKSKPNKEGTGLALFQQSYHSNLDLNTMIKPDFILDFDRFINANFNLSFRESINAPYSNTLLSVLLPIRYTDSSFIDYKNPKIIDYIREIRNSAAHTGQTKTIDNAREYRKLVIAFFKDYWCNNLI